MKYAGEQGEKILFSSLLQVHCTLNTGQAMNRYENDHSSVIEDDFVCCTIGQII